MRRVGFLFVFCAVFGSLLQAQDVTTTAVPFLLIAPNSRASAMGEGGVALGDDAWAIFWNPAGYAFQEGSEISMSHAKWLPALGLSDLWIAHVVYKQPVEALNGVLATSLTYENLGEFTRTLNDPTPVGTFKGYELAVAAGYSTKLHPTFGIGVNARIIYSHLADKGTGEEAGRGTATGFSFDVGLLYRPAHVYIPFTRLDLRDNLSLGLNVSNIGPNIYYVDKDQADPLPQNLRFGVAYRIINDDYNSLSASVEVNRLLVHRDTTSKKADEFYEALYTTWTGSSFSEQLRKFTTSVGVEYWYGNPKLIALRAGYFYEDPRSGNRKFYTFGAGIRYDIYGFDFSYISSVEEQHPLGETLRFTLSIAWGGK